MERSKKLVLSIGFTIILITSIIIAATLIHIVSTESYDYLTEKLIAPYVVFFIFPLILEEVTLLRSVYKLIYFSRKTSAKICYIISIVIVSLALIYQMLVFSHIITQDILPEGHKAASSRFQELLLLTEWPVLLVSFIFGSIKGNNEE